MEKILVTFEMLRTKTIEFVVEFFLFKSFTRKAAQSVHLFSLVVLSKRQPEMNLD